MSFQIFINWSIKYKRGDITGDISTGINSSFSRTESNCVFENICFLFVTQVDERLINKGNLLSVPESRCGVDVYSAPILVDKSQSKLLFQFYLIWHPILLKPRT